MRAQKFLRDLAASPPEHQLVLDDGACLLEALSCQRHALPRLSIVEQTTRGLIKIDENAALTERALEAPVVNVVGSDPKKYLEPPFIGAAVCDKLLRGVGARARPGPRDRCLLLGMGPSAGRWPPLPAIGWVLCASGFTCMTRTRRPSGRRGGTASRSLTAAIAASGSPPSGLLGRESFKVGDHVLLEDGACLAGATSGAVELSRERFIELAEASP